MFTLYYVGATFLQSWRIKSVCQKISEQLQHKASITFYALPDDKSTDGYDAILATSELCANRSIAKVSEILWLHGNRRGCCVMPLQSIPLMPWLSFPAAPGWLPFAHRESPPKLLEHLQASDKQHALYLLIETEIIRDFRRGLLDDDELVRVEDYGKLLAWKIDSSLAVIIETDVEHFTKLLLTTFLQHNYRINDHLPLLRIESIQIDGKPQPFELAASHLSKSKRVADRQTDDEWLKHLNDLRSLSVLANQATEFSYKKNRTEGKTGVVKPDLIPAEQKESETSKDTPPSKVALETPASNLESPKPAEEAKTATPQAKDSKTPPQAKDSKTPPALTESEKLIRAETKTNNETKVTGDSTKTPTPTKTSEDSTGSKLKAKPTAIKKPGVVSSSEGRFKTSKVPESPPKATESPISSSSSPAAAPKKYSPSKSSSSKKSNELEKIAAASVAQKHKSPLHFDKTPAAAGPQSAETANSQQTTSSQQATPQPPPSKGETKPSAEETKPSAEETKPSAEETKPSVEETKPSIEVTDSIKSHAVGGAAEGDKAPPLASGVSACKDNTRRPSLRRNKGSLKESKPLNILIYSDIASARENATAALREILERDMYTIYPITSAQVEQKHWVENTALLVVCGTVPANVGGILVDYFLHGGKVLSLCSDILHFILPNYRTAEVREHELVQFSYDKWRKVKMMHHIFCYQPSPVKKNFSTDSDDSLLQANVRKSALVCPRSIELKDLAGDPHNLDVVVLGTEETWNTPSLLLANNVKSGGKALFSQVHLETNPSDFMMDEIKFAVLKQNEKVRLEIFGDLLGRHLNVHVHQANEAAGSGVSSAGGDQSKCIYKNAYFLGHHEAKFEMLEKLKGQSGGATPNVLTTSKLTMQFCGQNDKPVAANTNVLPILIHSCPEDFSTVVYYQNLKTKYIGRLVIYAPIISSSMNVINELELTNGIAVLPRQQTDGSGRGGNQWLSPLGCAMFSIQLHLSLSSPLGSRLPLVQHVIGTAIVNSLRSHPTYKVLDIGIKWPNDIYANGSVKIGGLIVNSTLRGTQAIVNFGAGVNLNNSKPTLCINDMINQYNLQERAQLPLLQYEEFIALIFNEIERLVEQLESGDFDAFYKLYYDLWLHNEQSVKVTFSDGKERQATVIGIDDYGFLKTRVESSGAIEIVQPDGNSFDMLKGLIVPKFN